MFRSHLDALAVAERRIKIQKADDRFYVSFDDSRRLTVSTEDQRQATHWHRILTVRLAITLCGYEPRAEAGVYPFNIYTSFCHEMEKYHYVN